MPEVAAVRPRVLLAEDDPALRALLVDALEAGGFGVVQARDGEELLACIESAIKEHRHVAAVVSDVRMPGLWGNDVLAILHCSGRQMPFILITAFGDEETHAEAAELGAAAVFDKPFEVEDLCEAVRAVAR